MNYRLHFAFKKKNVERGDLEHIEIYVYFHHQKS